MALVLLAQAAGNPTAPVISVTTPTTTTAVVALVTPSTEAIYGIGSYDVSYSLLGPAGPFTTVNTATFPLTLSGLTPGTSYFIIARGVDLSLNRQRSPASNVVNATTPPAISAAPFPRLALHANAANVVGFDGVSFRLVCKYMNLVVLGTFDGWQVGRSMTMAQLTDDIRLNSVCPKGITYVYQYCDLFHVQTSIPNYSVYTANNWFVRTTFPSGPPVLNSGGANIANMNAGGPVDGGGRTCQMYQPDYITDWQYKGGVAGLAIRVNVANPNLDGTWFDDLTFESQDGGDFTRVGSDNGNSSAASAAIRSGWKFELQRFIAANPGKDVMVNTSQIQNHASSAEIAELAGLATGGGMEGQLGVSWATENFGGGWAGMMTNYIKQVNFCSNPEKTYFMHSCLSNTGKDPFRSSTPFQGVRYGLASCLMYDAPYCPCPNGAADAPSTTNTYDGRWWINWWADEFTVQPNTNQALSFAAGAPALGWLGDAVDIGPITAGDANGVLMRRFRRRSNNKIVYVVLNRKGNPATTWTPPVDVQYIRGVLETTVNSGATVTAGTPISLPTQDARFLLALT